MDGWIGKGLIAVYLKQQKEKNTPPLQTIQEIMKKNFSDLKSSFKDESAAAD